MNRTKCITFDREAQDTLPEGLKTRMKADRAVEHEKYKKEQSLLHIIRSGDKTYFVKFYDQDNRLLVHADNFIKAGILAMAYVILRDGVGYDIEYVEDLDGTKVPVYLK